MSKHYKFGKGRSNNNIMKNKMVEIKKMDETWLKIELCGTPH